MRLLIHAGTHKTASTYLQRVLVLNQETLRQRGLYVAPDALLAANHGTAWVALRDDFRHVAAHVSQAVKTGYSTALLSSEDFETLIFDHRRARAFEKAASAAGATAIEWHFCLRDPGEYFASMYAQLSRLAFISLADYAVLALRDGHVRVAREARHLPDYWELCFNYEKFMRAFAAAIEGTVVMHDFRDQIPFPGHGLVAAAIGALPSFTMPGGPARNARVTSAEVASNYRQMMDGVLGPAGVDDASRTAIAGTLTIPPDTATNIAGAVSRAFAPGMERLLAERIVRRD